MVTPLPVHSGRITHEMTTTAFTLAGHQVVRDLGVVMGITVRSRSIFGFIGASFETLRGGNIRRFTELCNRARSEAFDLMLEHAEQHGANVIGIRYDANEVMQGVRSALLWHGGAGGAADLSPARLEELEKEFLQRISEPARNRPNTIPATTPATAIDACRATA